MSFLHKARRASYRAGSILGDVNAADRAWKTRSPKPVVNRAIRKATYRKAGGALAKALRTILR